MGAKNNGFTEVKAVPDEKIIASLLEHKTVKSAAEAAGISTRTLYDRSKTKEFRSLYQSAKNDVLRKAVFTMNQSLSEAVNTIVEVMTNKDNNPATRLQAAQTLLNSAVKLSDKLSESENDAVELANTDPKWLRDLYE